MTDAIPGDVKRDRSKRLIELGNSIRARWLDAHIGPPLEVLVEDERVVDSTPICSGQTSDFVRVWFEGSGLLGSMQSVEATSARADGLEGRLLSSGEDSNMRDYIYQGA